MITFRQVLALFEYLAKWDEISSTETMTMVGISSCFLLILSMANASSDTAAVSNTGKAPSKQFATSACNALHGSNWSQDYTDCVDFLIDQNKGLLSLTQAQVGRACPRYSKMTNEERTGFIRGYIKNWALIESGGHTTGKTHAVAENQEETEGLFALRSSDLKYCNVDGDRKSPAVSIRCALNLMLGVKGTFSFGERVAGMVYRPMFFQSEVAIRRFRGRMKKEIPYCFN